MRYKQAMIAIALVVGLGLFVRQLAYSYENYDFRLEGSYCSAEHLSDWFSFERDGSAEFRYYYLADGIQKEDIGTFKKISDGKYILSSSQFHEVALVCFKEFPDTAGFRITLAGTQYRYIQTSIYPSQIISSSGGDLDGSGRQPDSSPARSFY